MLVSLLRLLGHDYNANELAGQLDRQHEFVNVALGEISRRARLVKGSHTVEDLVRGMLNDRLDNWLTKGQATTGGAVLGYRSRRDGKTLGLLKQPDEEDWSLFTCLNSLRDVEPGVALVLQDQGMDNEPGQVTSEHRETTE